MRDQEIIGLYEAYNQVYDQTQEEVEQLDEAMSSDPFDVILDHLISEGYADTNEAALAIMANMSKEWKQSIVESSEEDRKKNIERLRDYEIRYHKKKGGKPDPYRMELQNIRLRNRRPPA